MAFSKVEHLCDEGAGSVTLQVVRRGFGHEDVHVKWKTDNVNTIPSSYKDLEGEVTIKAGEFSSEIVLDIVDNDVWNMEAIQTMTLHSPSDNCVLGELKVTTIVVLNEVMCAWRGWCVLRTGLKCSGFLPIGY